MVLPTLRRPASRSVDYCPIAPSASRMWMSMTEPDATRMVKYCDEILPELLTDACGVDAGLARQVAQDVTRACRGVCRLVGPGAGRPDRSIRGGGVRPQTFGSTARPEGEGHCRHPQQRP